MRQLVFPLAPPLAPGQPTHHKAQGAEDDEDGDVGAHVGDGGADALPRALLPRPRHHLDLAGDGQEVGWGLIVVGGWAAGG